MTAQRKVWASGSAAGVVGAVVLAGDEEAAVLALA